MTTRPQCRATAAIHEWLITRKTPKPPRVPDAISTRSIPETSESRLQESSEARPLDIETVSKHLQQAPQSKETVLYLAYGSNLCDETFLRARGIRPLSQINVLVPKIVMTFDLMGMPYREPCFANVRYRTPSYPGSSPESKDYHKDRWHKPLIGTVYEVTLKDYAHIIATEGGGAGYQDVLVDCHALDKNPRQTVPEVPTNSAFKAHTLFDPAGKHRADPSYAQPSARYLKLITDGAMERGLPYEYQDYLHQIRPYRLTTTAQKLGQLVFLILWAPIFLFLFKIAAVLFAKPDGRYPQWLARLARVTFR